jgi:hypothetical protein
MSILHKEGQVPHGVLGNKYVAGIVGILLILVIVYNAQFFMSKNKKSSPTVNAQQAFTPQRVQKPSGSDRKAEKPQSVPAAEPSIKENKGIWKRDPFSLQAGTDSKTSEMADDIKLMGIIKRDGKSHALINGKVYGVNDRIGRTVIKEIKQHSIVIMSEGKKQEIVFDDYKVLKEKKK